MSEGMGDDGTPVADPGAHASRRARRAQTSSRSRPRGRATFLGVVAEIMMTAGVIALLYVAWQMWIGDWIIGSQKHGEATALSQSWLQQAVDPTPAPTASESPTPTPTDSASPSSPAAPVVPVMAPQDYGQQFGVMFVPRFGAGWQFTVASGTGRHDILDAGEIGHYPETAMPGEVGNTVYAAHRWTSGAPFDPIDKLVIGDAIVIQTREGWYTYRFRTLEYVQATQVEVLLPVPQQVGMAANGRYLTLTSCAPKLNMLERIIAYAVFDSFTPTSAGPPASLTQGVTA